MAIIKSGDGPGLLSVDSAAKAARGSLYGTDGSPLVFSSNRGRDVADILIRPTAILAAASVLWGIWNPSLNRAVNIYRIWVTPAFDGVAAATFMRFQIVKGVYTTNFSGGTQLFSMLKQTGTGDPQAMIRQATGAGMTANNSFLPTGPIYTLTFQRAMPAVTPLTATLAWLEAPQHNLEFDPPIELIQNEILYITNSVVSVVGDTLTGGCEFQETSL